MAGAALRTLIYLSSVQRPGGGFPPNLWMSGRAFREVQLDEVTFPILLAARLEHAQLCQDFDCFPMVAAAADYLVVYGPLTEQDSVIVDELDVEPALAFGRQRPPLRDHQCAVKGFKRFCGRPRAGRLLTPLIEH